MAKSKERIKGWKKGWMERRKKEEKEENEDGKERGRRDDLNHSVSISLSGELVLF